MPNSRTDSPLPIPAAVPPGAGRMAVLQALFDATIDGCIGLDVRRHRERDFATASAALDHVRAIGSHGQRRIALRALRDDLHHLPKAFDRTGRRCINPSIQPFNNQ